MTRREVTQTGKDSDGDITKLCNPTSVWRSRLKADAIRDIENKLNAYYVSVGGRSVDIEVVQGASGKYLRTVRDQTSTNNLDDLPNCTC